MAQPSFSTRFASASMVGTRLGQNSGYNAHQVKDAAISRSPGLRLEIVKRTDAVKGFVVLPRRWVVERTFSWFGRNRRLARTMRTSPTPSPPS